MKNQDRLAIIVPSRNEAKSLPLLVSRLDTVLTKAQIAYKIIIVDDRSTDNTAKVVKALSQKYLIIYHLKVGPLGKAFSLMEGSKLTKAPFIAMIDADLQYPPEALPEMVKLLPQTGVVVANRKTYKSSFLRRFASRLNSFLFGRLLFGFKCDIQSGLKVFRREIIDFINPQFVTAWTFDLSLLFTARLLGFPISQVNINYLKRKNGDSKISFLKTAWEISSQAVKLKLFHPRILQTNPQMNSQPLKAKIVYRNRHFVTYNELPFQQTALNTFTNWQKLILLLISGLIVSGLILKTQATAIGLVAILSFIYFADAFFSFFLIIKGLWRPPEIKVSQEEIAKLDPKTLPIYSILCPLYKEAQVLPQFVQAIKNLDWPKTKLEVLLLLEADDQTTINKAQTLALPEYFKIVIVPDSQPKTKPKACNFGLLQAKGEYIVIFDAEDKPERLQLKKAYLAFTKVSKKVVCLQAKLNYYNPRANLLTRLFTAEYSLWFNIILPGLQSIQTTIPLGGTSNYFKTALLRKLQGWDPFNVTEDCDLGIRLFKAGFQTAIFDSLTLEEANSRLPNWVRQRSRWLKGYLQTYLVHLRHPWQFFQQYGWHAIVFNLIIGLKIIFILVNPLLWLTTIAYFSFYAYVGPTIESLYPSFVFYMAAFSLIFGNFMYLYNYMIGCAKQKHWTIVKYVFLIPFYWLLMDLGALRAVFQLIFKPYFWEKTIHGFHLAKPKKVQVKLVKKSSCHPLWQNFLAKVRHPVIGPGSLLILAYIVANFCNLIYSAFLGRAISLEEFGLISLFSNFLFISQVFWGSLSQTVTHRTAYLFGKFNIRAQNFWQSIRKKAFKISLIITGLWLLLIPFLPTFFKSVDFLPFLLFTPVLTVGLMGAVDAGFLTGNLKFINLALLAFLEPLIKLMVAYQLVNLKLTPWVYSAIPLSMVTTFLIGWLMARAIKEKKQRLTEDQLHFPKKFFGTAILGSLAASAFLSLDVIFVKFLLPPKQAGLYALLALSGKMIFFAAGLFNGFVNPLISHALGAGKNTKKVFYRVFILNIIISVLGFVGIGIFGQYTLPLLFGSKVTPILPLLPLYCLGIASFSIGNCLVTYHQARKEYLLTRVSFLLALVQVAGLILFHGNLLQVTEVISICGFSFLITMSLLHLFYWPLMIFASNILDFLGLFGRVLPLTPLADNKLRILVFNWRDLKHKWAGGAEVYIHELSKRWVKNGHQVTLFCGNDGKHNRNDSIDGVQIVRRGGFYMVYLWAFLYYLFQFKAKFDVVIDCENGIPFFTPLYVKEKKILLIHHVHQEVFRKSLSLPFSWLASFLEIQLMPLVYRRTKIVTVSPSSKMDILDHRLTTKEPAIIYNGVDLTKYQPAKKSSLPMILYLGRLKYYKSLHILIRAAKKVLFSRPEIKFVIAGDGEQSHKLKKYAAKLGILDKIDFLGKVSEAEKIRLYQKAWVFVNPSLIEGWGITSIEANACATPVIASNVAGLRDSIYNPHSGMLFPYGDDEELSKQILNLVQNRSLRQEMMKEAVAWAKKYSWEKSAEEFYQIIKD